MRVLKLKPPSGKISWEVLDESERPIKEVSAFLRHLAARAYSSNTVKAYAYDLLHFTRFLESQSLTFQDFTPPRSLDFLEYLRTVISQKRVQRFGLALCEAGENRSGLRLSGSTINRILAAVSSFFEFLIVSGELHTPENPIVKVADPVLSRIGGPHRPFMSEVSRQRPVRRAIKVKTADKLPRPMSDEQVAELLTSVRWLRDKAMLCLMVQGGLRPGEVLNLHLEDIQYGKRRIIVRFRSDHPKGVRTKSRNERVVDLHEPETLAVVSAYVMQERPQDTSESHLFLVGGKGSKRHEPLGYDALVKMFSRHCERLKIREPWVTPHALRHTHATKMFEAGMRELTLQKRLGHRSIDSTRVYTRVSDTQVVAEYTAALRSKKQS